MSRPAVWGENPDWIPPMEYVMKKQAPAGELTAWLDKTYGKSYRVMNLIGESKLLVRVYTSDKSKRMQFKLRWSDWIDRPYNSY